MTEFLDKMRDKAKKPAELLFFAGLLIELLIVILDKSAYCLPWEGMLFRVTFLLFAAKAAVTKYDRGEWIWLGLFLILGAVSWRVTGRNEILRFTVFAAACKGIDGRKILKVMLFATAFGSAGIILLSLLHVLGTVTVTENFDGAPSTRFVFGMGNPNAFHAMMAMLLILALYLFGKKMKIWHAVCLLVLDGILFYLTRSSMGAAAMAAAILWTMALRTKLSEKLSSRGFALGCEAAFLAVFAFTIAGAIWGVKNSVIRMIDDRFLTGRIATIWDFTFHDGTLSTWTLFGSRLNTRYFDLGWIRLIYWYGVIPAAFIIAAYLLLFRRVRKTRDAYALMFITILCAYTAMEAHLVSVYIARNYMLVLFASLGVFASGRIDPKE